MIKNTALFYTCSLVEYIGRITKNERSRVVELLGKDVNRIYNYQEVFHCEPIEKVADDFIARNNIPLGSFDNVANCKYAVPDYWDIGDVFARLVEDNFAEKDSISGIKKFSRPGLHRKFQTIIPTCFTNLGNISTPATRAAKYWPHRQWLCRNLQKGTYFITTTRRLKHFVSHCFHPELHRHSSPIIGNFQGFGQNGVLTHHIFSYIYRYGR